MPGAEVLTWNHFALLLALLSAWSLLIIGTARWAIATGLKGINDNIALNMKAIDEKVEKQEKAMEERIARQDEKAGKAAENQQKLERELLEIRAELPSCYVRREDFIRNEVTINTKLDRLRDLIERKGDLA